MVSARSGEAQITIAAPPEQVWALLADVERMGEWSPECYQVRWLADARSPATVGARFKGSNRFGWLRWSMTCEIKSADPGSELSWSTVKGERELVRWRYRLIPTAGGTQLTESFDVVWLRVDARIAEDYLMRDRDRRRLAAMHETLERIKSVAEAREASGATHSQ